MDKGGKSIYRRFVGEENATKVTDVELKLGIARTAILAVQIQVPDGRT